MSKFAVVPGDPTSHGGNVSSASSSFQIEGKNTALLDDTVTCPEHGTNESFNGAREADRRYFWRFCPQYAPLANFGREGGQLSDCF